MYCGDEVLPVSLQDQRNVLCGCLVSASSHTVALITFTLLCDHHHHLFAKILFTPNRNSVFIKQQLLISSSSSAPGNHSSIFCTYGLAYSRYNPFYFCIVSSSVPSFFLIWIFLVNIVKVCQFYWSFERIRFYFCDFSLLSFYLLLSFVSILIFIIFMPLPAFFLVCSSFSISLKCTLRLFIWDFFSF